MRRNISATFAILAFASVVLFSSCNMAPSGVANNPAGYAQQTNAIKIVYQGTIQGQFLDHTMVPVTVCGTSDTLWAYYADNDYKTAVEANQAVATGKTVNVKMLLTQLPLATRTYLFRITSTSIVVAPVKDTATVVSIPLPKKPAPKKKTTRRNPCDQPGSANVVEQEVHSLIKQGYVQQPCGTNVTIHGDVYIELGSGNATKSKE